MNKKITQTCLIALLIHLLLSHTQSQASCTQSHTVTCSHTCTVTLAYTQSLCNYYIHIVFPPSLSPLSLPSSLLHSSPSLPRSSPGLQVSHVPADSIWGVVDFIGCSWRTSPRRSLSALGPDIYLQHTPPGKRRSEREANINSEWVRESPKSTCVLASERSLMSRLRICVLLRLDPF